MPNYFIVENNKIINIIIAESKEIAEQVTGFEAINADENRQPGMNVGSVFVDGTWTAENQES